MKVFLFHCWGGNGQSCWSGWLADELRKRSIEVVSPDFPNSSKPVLSEWLESVRSQVQNFNPEDGWVLVGHSLGCPTILRLLESFGEGEKVKSVVLVAGFAKDLDIPQIKNFVDKKFNWDRIKSKSDSFFVINSDNDPYIELSEGERLSNLLDAELIVEHGAGHINEGSGFIEYKRLLDLILKL